MADDEANTLVVDQEFMDIEPMIVNQRSDLITSSNTQNVANPEDECLCGSEQCSTLHLSRELDSIFDPSNPFNTLVLSQPDKLWLLLAHNHRGDVESYQKCLNNLRPHAKCGYAWPAGYVSYRCRTCSVQPTMALCTDCFRAGNHKEHDYNMFKSRIGGACDCGMADLMKESGFCSKHKPVYGKSEIPIPKHLTCVPHRAMPRIINHLALLLRNTSNNASNEIDRHISRLTNLANSSDIIRRVMAEVLLSERNYSSQLELLKNYPEEPVTKITSLGDKEFEQEKRKLINFKPPPNWQLPQEVIKAFGDFDRHKTFLDEMIFWMVAKEFDQKLVCFLLLFFVYDDYMEEFSRKFVKHYPHAARYLLNPPLQNESRRFSSDSNEQLSRRMLQVSVQIYNKSDLTRKLCDDQALHTLIYCLRLAIEGLPADGLSGSLSTNCLCHHHDDSLYVISANSSTIRDRYLGSFTEDLTSILEFDHEAKRLLQDQGLLYIWLKMLSYFQTMNPYKRELNEHTPYDTSPHVHSWFSIEAEFCMSPLWTILSHFKNEIALNYSCKLIEAIHTTLAEWFHQMWIGPNSQLDAYYMSFHIPLHRMLAATLRHAIFIQKASGPSIHNLLSKTQLSLGEKHGGYGTARDANVILGVKDFLRMLLLHPLQALTLYHQTRCNMWARNGLMAMNQAISYVHGPHSYSTIDLDMFLLKYCASKIKADTFIKTVMQNFYAWHCLSFVHDSIFSDYLSETLRLRYHFSIQPEQLSQMVESCFVTLIQLVTLNVHCDIEDIDQLKQELVTLVSVADRPYSYICDMLPDKKSSEVFRMEDKISIMLKEITIYKPPQHGGSGGLQQGTYTLKPEIWDAAYNPIYVLYRYYQRRDYQMSLQRFFQSARLSLKLDRRLHSSSLWPPLVVPKKIGVFGPLDITQTLTCPTILGVIFSLIYRALYIEEVSETLLAYTIHLLELSLRVSLLQSPTTNHSRGNTSENPSFEGRYSYGRLESTPSGVNKSSKEPLLGSFVQSQVGTVDYKSLDARDDHTLFPIVENALDLSFDLTWFPFESSLHNALVHIETVHSIDKKDFHDLLSKNKVIGNRSTQSPTDIGSSKGGKSGATCTQSNQVPSDSSIVDSEIQSNDWTSFENDTTTKEIIEASRIDVPETGDSDVSMTDESVAEDRIPDLLDQIELDNTSDSTNARHADSDTRRLSESTSRVSSADDSSATLYHAIRTSRWRAPVRPDQDLSIDIAYMLSRFREFRRQVNNNASSSATRALLDEFSTTSSGSNNQRPITSRHVVRSRKLRREYKLHHGESIFSLLLRFHAKCAGSINSYKYDERRARHNLDPESRSRVGDGAHFTGIVLDLICMSNEHIMLPKLDHLKSLIWPKTNQQIVDKTNEPVFSTQETGIDIHNNKFENHLKHCLAEHDDSTLQNPNTASVVQSIISNHPESASDNLHRNTQAQRERRSDNVRTSAHQVRQASSGVAHVVQPKKNYEQANLINITERRKRAKERQNKLMAEFANRQRAFMKNYEASTLDNSASSSEPANSCGNTTSAHASTNSSTQRGEFNRDLPINLSSKSSIDLQLKSQQLQDKVSSVITRTHQQTGVAQRNSFVHSKLENSPRYECCICGVEGSSDASNPLGQVVLLQSTSVFGHSHLRPKEERKLPIGDEEQAELKLETYAKYLECRIDLLAEHFSESSWLDAINIGAEGGVYVQSCGHYLHISCHQSYVRSLDQDDRIRARPNTDEFLCPVCRQLANSVLPIIMTSSARSVNDPPVALVLSSQLDDQVALISSELKHRTHPLQQELDASAAFCSHLTKATESRYRTVRSKKSMHSLFLFLTSIARTNLETGLIIRSLQRHTNFTSLTSFSESSVLSSRDHPDIAGTSRQSEKSIGGERTLRSTTSCTFQLLFNVLALHAQTSIEDQWLSCDQVWSQLTHIINEKDLLKVKPANSEVPLLLKDPTAMLLQFLFSISNPALCYQANFTCMVRMLFNLTVIQSIGLVLSYVRESIPYKYSRVSTREVEMNCRTEQDDSTKKINEIECKLPLNSSDISATSSSHSQAPNMRNQFSQVSKNQSRDEFTNRLAHLIAIVEASLSPLLNPTIEEPLLFPMVRSCWPRLTGNMSKKAKAVIFETEDSATTFIANKVKLACMPFMRAAAFLQEHLYGRDMPYLMLLEDDSLVTESCVIEKDFSALVEYLDLAMRQSLSSSVGRCCDQDQLMRALSWTLTAGQNGERLISSWSAELLRFAQDFSIAARTLFICRPLSWHRPALMQLPRLFDDIFMFYYMKKCTLCTQVPKDVAVCLVCGAPICFRTSSCCKDRSRSRQVHVQHCGANTAVFLAIHTSSIVIIRGNRACMWGSVYLDAHDEEDNGLQRGNPLYLVPERYALLEAQWLKHNFDHTSGKRWIFMQEN